MSTRKPPAQKPNDVTHGQRNDKSTNLGMLSLGALGVVFGDIGTSPLYAMRQCFQNLHTASVDAGSVMGIL